MLMFTLAISCLNTSNLPWFMDNQGNIPGSYAILLFIGSDFTSITSHIHNWAMFLLWLSLFIPSGTVSLLFYSSILGTYQPGEFIFQCHISLSFHTVHGVLKARMLKLFAIPFSSGWHFVRTLHHDLSVLGGHAWHGSYWVRQGCDPCSHFASLSVTVVFILSAHWWMRLRGLWKLPDGRDSLWGKLCLALVGRAMLRKSLFQFSVDGWSCLPSL